MFKLCFCNLSYVNICILVEDMNETTHEPSGLCSLVWWDKFLSFHRQISCHTSSLLGTIRSPQRCGSRKWNTRSPCPPSTDPRVNGFLCGLLNNKTGDRIVANLFCPNISRKNGLGKFTRVTGNTWHWESVTRDRWRHLTLDCHLLHAFLYIYMCVRLCVLHNIACSLCRWGWGDYGQELWPHAWWCSSYSPSTSLTVTSYVTTFSLFAKTIFKGNLPPSLSTSFFPSLTAPRPERTEREIIFPVFFVFSFYYFPFDRRQLISEAQLIKEIFFTIGFSY